MKTGVILKSDDFDIKNGETIFNQVSLNNVFVHGENWRESNSHNGVSEEDIKHYLELLSEGMALGIEFLEKKGVDTTTNLLQKYKARIDKALFKPCEMVESKKREDFKATEIKLTGEQREAE